MSSEPDVLIAGAGPTGLTLACGLLAQGVPARVVDKAAGPAGTSRALGLQPRGIEVVDRLGALSGLGDHALEVEQIVVHINGKQAARVRVGQRTPLVTRPGLVISQADVEAALRARVTELGGQILWGQELTVAEQNAHGVRVGFANGDERWVNWLVGCDGAHSRVRELAGIGFPGAPLAERFLLVDVHADLPLSRHAIYMWLDGESVFGAFPLPGHDMWRLMAPTADANSMQTDTAVLSEVARLLGERTDCDPTLIRDPEWITAFRVHRRLAERFRTGRILLAGDAAHVHSPFGGQGMNTGIGDAENLAWKLALVINGTAAPDLLNTYEAERRPIAARALKSTGAAGNLILGHHLLARLLRDRLVVPLMNRSWIQRRVWENLSQLKVSYRNGPLGHRSRFSARGPLPGDRIPNIGAVQASDGTHTTLHAELGNKWALVTPARSMIDEYVTFVTKRLGHDRIVTLIAPGEPMLVRPDAHLAWRGPATPAALDHWLATVVQHGQAPQH